MVIFSHPTGNANARAAAYGLAKAGILKEFYTSIASFEGDFLDRLSDIPSLSEIKRRKFHQDLKAITSTWPWMELGRLLSAKAGLSSLTAHETGLFSVDHVYQSIDKRASLSLRSPYKTAVKAIYSYEDAARISFSTARKNGLSCIYDLPIGYWRTARKLLESERTIWPEWAATLTGFKDSEEKLSRKDEELKMADLILVASQFTAKTLEDFPGQLAPVKVIPYGFPPVGEGRHYASSIGQQRPLKLLFVGGLSQRKGIANLFEAVKRLGKHVELTIVGGKANNDCKILNEELSRYRWIPSLPHHEILAIMREHDVLVFPSLFEGFGLVITEAMSQGTPVITTDRTAGPDLIKHGDNGWLIEAGSTDALENAISEILHKPSLVAMAGENAMDTARMRPWERYGYELAETVAATIK